jgi:hypothetical protein
MAGGGGDQAIEQAGGLNLVAPAERLDDALDVATALADVLDEVRRRPTITASGGRSR